MIEKKCDALVYNAIKKGRHKTSNIKLKRQTWRDFYKSVQNRKLILFGIGAGLDAFMRMNTDKRKIDAILDNDSCKQGIAVSSFCESCIFDSEQLVSSPSYLSKLENDSYVVLITSLKYYEEIAEQLHGLGVKNYFAFLPMEEKRLRDNKILENDIQDFGSIEEENMPINDNKIVFYTMGTYSGNGKAIVEKLLCQRSDLEIVWVVKDMGIDVPHGIRCIYRNNKTTYLREMMTAKMWIYDGVIPSYLNKRDGQIYIQVKHWPSITLKSFGLPLGKFVKDKIYMENCIHDGQMIDYVFSGSEFDARTFREGFDYHGQVIQIGSPRSDIFFQNEDVRQRIFEKYQVRDNQKIVVYAPTFRMGADGKQTLPDEMIDYTRVLEQIQQSFGGEWVMFVRFHPNLSWQGNELDSSESIIDVTSYPDGQEIVAASDIVITDYSNVMFEPSFIKKPVFLFAPDREAYINGERELLIPYDTLPFSIAETNGELLDNIATFCKEEYEQQVSQFLEQYGVREDGHATERAAEFILNLLEKE